MLEDKTALEATINEKKYIFICDKNASVGEIFDALYFFQSHVLEVIKKNRDNHMEIAKPNSQNTREQEVDMNASLEKNNGAS